MSQDFYQHIFAKQQNLEAVPSNREITAWALKVIHLLYPEQTGQLYASVEELKSEFVRLENELCEIMHATKACSNCDTSKLAKKFFESLPELFRILNTDIQAIFNGDPAARSEFEVIRTYPGFYAISLYRVAHSLYIDDIPLLPRILTEYAHSKTGIDIHPAAKIDEYFYIDHGTGIVIGESCKIGKHVKLYQGVTLGALSVDKSMANTKRHPTVEDNVVIYSGATILGGETIIGHNSVVGGNVWLTKSLPPNSRVYHTPNHRILKRLSIKLFGERK
ncbi:serine O-acetyltransferase EpsC [Mucilaginibacter sp. cycad4]|uniref:serine O-acetyltransferase EpsC n=1 Tax=Mucilaginibacter sp. cycad4 TaxID=3342096 RepID=UPI002AAA8A8C|nr:serine O-acetyltransferase EpsC [Mucilaginibacter gossypii]WPU98873.1 serine O-acetyltransferase EpsC [Mucilaginibacter gossypii]